MAADYKLVIQQGATFSKTLLFGTGAIFKITSFEDAGGGSLTINAPHNFSNGDKVKIIAVRSATSGGSFGNVNYTGVYTIANVVAGVSFTITATWQGSISGTAQASRDMTGKLIRWQVRDEYSDAAAVFSLTASFTDESGGVAVASMTSVETAAEDATSSAVHTCEVYDTGDPVVVERVLEGVAVVTPEAAK